jgi:hypothetical protein
MTKRIAKSNNIKRRRDRRRRGKRRDQRRPLKQRLKIKMIMVER